MSSNYSLRRILWVAGDKRILGSMCFHPCQVQAAQAKSRAPKAQRSFHGFVIPELLLKCSAFFVPSHPFLEPDSPSKLRDIAVGTGVPYALHFI
ncbi:hypothetical protein BDZ97DRAFT_1846948 [Flammula alnicola]|nr:hypothetical protein BDZ97DRAFT_1846948 [Flammula alnicola]